MSVKEMYVGFTFKGKMSIEDESGTGKKVLVATPKSAEISSLKISFQDNELLEYDFSLESNKKLFRSGENIASNENLVLSEIQVFVTV